MFKTGDPIIHPVRGAGIVVRVEKRTWHGGNGLYYRIELLGQQGISLMVPVEAAEALGLRRAISRSKVGQVWRVLSAEPDVLPADHKERYELLREKLYAGDTLKVAEAVRDMAWRQHREGRLTAVGKRIYEEGITLLAGEIAATQDTQVADAETQIRARLTERMSPDYRDALLTSRAPDVAAA